MTATPQTPGSRPELPADRDHSRPDTWAQLQIEHDESEPIPAATVVVLRDGDEGLETLMLRKNSNIAFGGMWVFPGGRVDENDKVIGCDGKPDDLATAAAAAVREAAEEASVSVEANSLVWFSFWLPPQGMPVRFATFFFATRLSEVAEYVTIDDGEITDHEWMRPVDALLKRDAGELELAPPTWMTISRLARFKSVDEALAELGAEEPQHYETHLARTDDGPVAMWAGDVGYEVSDPTLEGPRHRLTMTEDEYQFEDTRPQK
ncbi:MAG TPA: NUDIX hydrolase [Acidimicrobiaceae bacterium]|nr:NUDIX hydrolase [Acidimicrobiaceae bacterium]